MTISSRLLIVVTITIALIGQTFAYPQMACEVMTDDSNMHMQMMQHEGMQHTDLDFTAMDDNGDCCDTDCKCPANACTSYSAIASVPTFQTDPIIAERIRLVASEHPDVATSLLFRPPIFA